ncbi:MAG: radical SAM protein [Desulfuromonadales bacterium]
MCAERILTLRIALVAIHPSPSPQAVPLANAFLSSYTLDSSVETILLDFFADKSAISCAAEIVAAQPDAVGFSLYLWNRLLSLEIAAELARSLPGIRLFAGGPEATADPRRVLAAAPLAFLIVGEGEKPFRAVCSRLAAGMDVAGIPGVAMLHEGCVVMAPPAMPADPDTIPSPYLTGILDTRRYPGILWQLSRGCGFACEYCFDSRDGHGVRRFSLERIEAELRHFAITGVSQVFVLDSTFNQDVQRAKLILKLIRRIAPGIHFHFEVRSEFIDREMSRLFAQITCSLQIGLQSADPLVLRAVGRSFNKREFCARITLLNESGAVFGFDLMYGLPGDTLRGFCESIDFALSLYPNHLDIFPLALLPGTPLAARSDAIGLQHHDAPPYTLISSPTFSPEEMELAQRLATACDIFYTRGKAVAWFNAVIAPLGMKPSLFLRKFGEWLTDERGPVDSEAELDDGEIWRSQRAFLTGMFSRNKLRRLLPVVLDLVDYHYHYAAALQTPLPELPSAGKLKQVHLPDIPCRLSPASRLAVFNYEILDILEAGAPDVRVFTDRFPQSGSWAVIYPGRQGICCESLSEPYYRLLEQLDGLSFSGRIASQLGIPPGEARSFLKFAAAEGIIVLSG